MLADPSLWIVMARIATARGMQYGSAHVAARFSAMRSASGLMPRSAAKNTNGALSPCKKISQAAESPAMLGSGMVSCSSSKPIST